MADCFVRGPLSSAVTSLQVLEMQFLQKLLGVFIAVLQDSQPQYLCIHDKKYESETLLYK